MRENVARHELKRVVKPKVLVLIGLIDGRPRSRKELAKELGLSWSTVDSVVYKLVSEGLVEEREGSFVITERGRNFLKHALRTICGLSGDF